MTKMTIFEMDQNLREILDQTDPETGEIPMEFQSLMVNAKNHKCPNILEYAEMVDAEAEVLEVQLRKWQAVVKRKRAKAEYLREIVKGFMQRWGITEIASTIYAFKAKLYKDRDYSAEVYDMNQLPKEYVKTIPESKKADLTMIRRDLKDGIVIPGAKLNFKDRLEIRH